MACGQPVGPGVLGGLMRRTAIVFLFCIFLLTVLSGCRFNEEKTETITITDQMGRKVKIPAKIERICALHHFGGKIAYALKQQHLMVDTGIYGREAVALGAIDSDFSAKPNFSQGHDYNIEGLLNLGPQVVFATPASSPADVAVFTNAGVPVVGVAGETFEQSFEAVRLMGNVLHCEENAKIYIDACTGLLDMVKTRLEKREGPPVKVLFAGPMSIYSAATGSMLQTKILELSGAVNVAKELQGFWADVSPEQVAAWNPDVVFLGSSLETYGRAHIYENPHFKTVAAIQNKRVYTFPSSVGWWDYPAPHCVLGVVWSAKTLYPDLFSDVDMMAVANEFYLKFVGHSFEEMGGRLE